MGVHTFPKGICPKVNVIARLEYELTYNDSAVHRFNHYTTRTPPQKVSKEEKRRQKKKKIYESKIEKNIKIAMKIRTLLSKDYSCIRS